MPELKRLRISGVPETYKIGKAKLNIYITGCVRCGSDTSAAWHFDRTVTVIIGGRSYDLEVQCCVEFK
jgi:ribosomal protein S27AE